MKWLKRILLALFVILLLMQFYRPAHTNPPIEAKNTIQAAMPVPKDVDAILDRSCNDCHSNRTVWPWYSNVAPMSWLLVDHVKEGRQELNFSEFATYSARRKGRKFQEICEQIKEGEMPLDQYVILHPEAKLSAAERQRLCQWSEPFATKRKTQTPTRPGS
jgi:hypothetical protein